LGENRPQDCGSSQEISFGDENMIVSVTQDAEKERACVVKYEVYVRLDVGGL